MTEPLHPVAVSDELISALSERRRIDAADPLLRSLQAWVQRIDSQPMAPWRRPLRPVVKAASSVERARRVAALTLALTLSSSGLATAVTGDPLSPLHFVKRQITSLRRAEFHHAPRWPEGKGQVGPGRAAIPELSRSLERPERSAVPRAAHSVLQRPLSP